MGGNGFGGLFRNTDESNVLGIAKGAYAMLSFRHLLSRQTKVTPRNLFVWVVGVMFLSAPFFYSPSSARMSSLSLTSSRRETNGTEFFTGNGAGLFSAFFE